MKRMMIVLVMVFVSAWSTFAEGDVPSNELRRQIYELNALMLVVQLQVDVYSLGGEWQQSSTANFDGDEASLSMDITPGPQYYRGYAYWKDELGSPLFYSSEYKASWFHAGMNVKDFPVQLNPSRLIRLKIQGPTSGDTVWVNGSQAWFEMGYWYVYIYQPWLIDELSIIWTGHGGWMVDVSPSFPFGELVYLAAGDMDPGQDSVSQMSALSYSGEGSWIGGVATYEGKFYDQSQGCDVVEMSTTIPNGTSVMVFFSYYSSYDGTLEYHNYSTQVADQTILVPLGQTWFEPSYASIRVVYTDADGNVRQTWASSGTVVIGGGGEG